MEACTSSRDDSTAWIVAACITCECTCEARISATPSSMLSSLAVLLAAALATAALAAAPATPLAIRTTASCERATQVQVRGGQGAAGGSAIV
tara:strand:- start:58 stop:333 length:276 start_codon:yes stop_codon:yes gene_type:complete